MTTEHVSVPREFLRHVDDLILCIEAFGAAQVPLCRDLIESRNAILSRATPSDDKTSAPRVVTDMEEVLVSLSDDAAYLRMENDGDSEIADNMERAAEIIESLATSMPAARVPDGFIELLARAEDVANVDWTHMESGSWQKMRGLRTAIGMAKMSMLDAATQAGERG